MVDQNALHMVRETDNVSALLASGLVFLSTRGWSISDHAATFTDLTSGVERLMKLSAGLAHLEDSGQWPEMSAYGHQIVRLKR